MKTRWSCGRTSPLLIIGLLVSVATAARAAEGVTAADPRGPIPLRDMRPYNLLFLQFMPETSDVIPAGRSIYSMQLDIANNLLIPDRGTGSTVVEDNEYQRLMFSWRRGLGRGMELGVWAPIEWRDGGMLDTIISAYHKLIGVPASAMDDPLGRNHWPKYRSILELVNSKGQVLVNQGNGFGLGETSITLKRSLTPATRRSSSAVRLGIKLPTGNPDLLLGTGRPDVGISLDGRYNVLSNVITYMNLGFVAMGSSNVPGARHEMGQLLAGLEYRATRRDSFVFQIDRNTLAVRTGNRFADQPQQTATWGYERILSRRLMLWGAYSENGDIHNYRINVINDIGPDVTFTAGIKWRP